MFVQAVVSRQEPFSGKESLRCTMVDISPRSLFCFGECSALEEIKLQLFILWTVMIKPFFNIFYFQISLWIFLNSFFKLNLLQTLVVRFQLNRGDYPISIAMTSVFFKTFLRIILKLILILKFNICS